MIAVAYNNKGLPISIVQARNIREARIYWQGQGIVAVTEKEIEEYPEGDEMVLVIPILKTKSSDNGHNLTPNPKVEVIA